MAPSPVHDSTLTDEALMQRLQQGDDHALSPLMVRWELPVKAFLLRLGVRASDVEDLAQETFVRLYQKRASFRPGSTLKPWLLTLAGNLGRNRLRWRFRRREDSYEETFVALDTTDPQASHLAEQEAQHLREQHVREAIVTLPDKLRQVVVCVDLEELSYQEAAQVLDCSTKAIETRLYRARQQLREKLRPLLP